MTKEREQIARAAAVFAGERRDDWALARLLAAVLDLPLSDPAWNLIPEGKSAWRRESPGATGTEAS